MRRLFMPGWYSGFSNNKMSFEIAMILAYLTDRVLTPYRFRMPLRTLPGADAMHVPEPASVPDLFEIPIPWSDEFLLKTWISTPDAVDCQWPPILESVFVGTNPGVKDDPTFQQFRNGRPHLCAFNQAQHEATDLHVRTEALAHYSYFFYLDDPNRRAVIELIKRFQPKLPYRQAIADIAACLGTFNAIHIRRGDFLVNELQRHGFTRTPSVTGEELLSNVSSRLNRDDTLVVCTDGAPDEDVFTPIRRHFRDVIFLDQYLQDDPRCREIIAALPRADEPVIALITQGVATRATLFIGTLFSTFTALINRERGLSGLDPCFLYSHNDFLSPRYLAEDGLPANVRYVDCEFLPVSEGVYSWNRLALPLSPGTFSWIRDWPEAFEAGGETNSQYPETPSANGRDTGSR